MANGNVKSCSILSSHHQLLGKCKSKPQIDMPSQRHNYSDDSTKAKQTNTSNSNNRKQKIASIVEDGEKLEPL